MKKKLTKEDVLNDERSTQQEKYHYVYVITNKVNKKFYIGKHSTSNLDDGYMGSGVAINRAIKKYGEQNFVKRILCYCQTASDALYVEQFLVTEYIVNRKDCYNMKTGGKGGSAKGRISGMKGRHHSEETKQKLKLAWKKRRQKPVSEETRKKIGEAHKGKPGGMKGKHHSEDTKMKISNSLQNMSYEAKKERGKKISEANGGKKRPKLSEALKNSEKNKNRKRDKNGRFTK